MGGTISQAANGLGNALSVPLKSIFGGTCEDVCTGPLDLICFIEHICVVNLLKLFIICFLSYITLLFIYLLFKLGVFQCVGRSLCRCCWTACGTYWSTLGHVSCLMWRKLINTKRVYRGRRSHLRLNRAREAHGEYVVKDESDDSNARQSSYRKRKFSEDIGDCHGVVCRQKSNKHRHHHRHRSHRHQSDMGTKQVTMGLQRWGSTRDHHERNRHLGAGGEVDRRLSFKRKRVER